MTDSAATDHCYTPSWCKCPDEPKCQLCKQGRCPVEPETSTAPEPIYGKPFHGWSCECDECQGYDERGEPRPGEAPATTAAQRCDFWRSCERCQSADDCETCDDCRHWHMIAAMAVGGDRAD